MCRTVARMKNQIKGAREVCDEDVFLIGPHRAQAVRRDIESHQVAGESLE